jgi:phage portal protein BeeE
MKAVYGGGWLSAYQQGDIPLSSLNTTPQQRAAASLRAYKVGWFYKAEHKIAEDIANLDVFVAPEDTEGDNEVAIIEPDLFTPWERLDPIGQFLRLMERPNPNQTGRQLRAKTQIRIDMAGTAFWYLEGATSGLPTAIYGISPSRMWDARDDQGNIIGWVMDRDDRGGGTPFLPEEILVFATSSTEDGSPWGTGIVEAVYSELPLSDLMARHTTDLLMTGGRLAGMMWPKDRALSEPEMEDAVRSWRNVASDPNAARRLLLFPEPMEWAPGASTPADIGIPELSLLNRDNILTAFPISPYMLGVPTPGGLNASGEVRREEKLGYQEGTIHPRVELFEETVQVGLLSRYEAIMGTTYDFEIAEPNLDTAPALIEKVGALRALIAAGFDDKEAVAAVGLDHIKYNGPPAPVVAVVPPADATGAAGLTANATGEPDQVVRVREPVVKAEIEDQRDDLVRASVTTAKSSLSTFLTEQQARIAERIRTTGTKAKKGTKADPGDWWDADVEDAELRATMRGIYVSVGRSGLQAVADNLGRLVGQFAVRNVINDLLTYGGDRIKGINEATQKAIQSVLAEGTRRGYSLNQLIDGVSDEGYGGVAGALLDNGTAAFDDYRAEVIARTETMLSFNRATVTGYGEFGVERLLAYDGDQDNECAARAGLEFSIDEALGIEDHPNGTLVWSPVVDKAVDFDREDRLYELAAKAIEAKPTEIHVHNAVTPPDVHVEMAPTTIPVSIAAAEVNVPPTVVNVNVPEAVVPITVSPSEVTVVPGVVNVNVPEQPIPVVNVAAAEVLPAIVTVNIPEQKRVTKTIKRDKSGAITRIEES